MMAGASVVDSPAVLSVAALTELIRLRIESDHRLNQCYVTGELSNFKRHTSGHLYFTLKDDKSRIRAVMFAGKARALRFHPEDGMRVICQGNVSVFDRDGQYQLYVDDMQPDGVGALYVAFTQLRDRLEAEGLFDLARKRALPAFPRVIGVVTSPTGAVIRDICTTLARRYPLAKVILAPALVQGPGAAQTIVKGIAELTDPANPHQVDVLIVGRGGGSLEELWPFNEEVVARAVAACPIPIISAVGHETDVTICDFVADVRAATPTAAAELAAPSVVDLNRQLTEQMGRARVALQNQLTLAQRHLKVLATSAVLVRPQQSIDFRRQTLDYLEGQLRQHATRPLSRAVRQVTDLTARLHRVDVSVRLVQARVALSRIHQNADSALRKTVDLAHRGLARNMASLEALNPLSVLRRGYSVVYDAQAESVISAVQQVSAGTLLRIRLADGTIQAKVTDKESEQREWGEQARLDL